VRILVAVKQVAQLAEDYEPDGAAVPASALTWQLNECDAYALEGALRLIEADGDGEVVVASVGEEHAEVGLRSCLAMGAARAIRIWGQELEGADPLTVAAALAALARREEPDLILCGAQSSDAANAATGAALAGLLDLPRVAVASEVERDGASLLVERELDGGAIELLRVGLPALLGVHAGPHPPRRPNLRAIKQAREQPLESIAPADLGLGSEELAAARGARTVRMLAPERGVGASMIEGTPGEIAERIAQLVGEGLGR
jgi:electron transfer flavoprotein beta subunit